MNFTIEQLKKAKACKTLEELKELAKVEGVNLTDSELNEIFNLTRNGELKDEDLSKIAGGTKYSKGVLGPQGWQKYAIVTLITANGRACRKAGIDCLSIYDLQKYATVCGECFKMFPEGPTCYCGARWEGNDPLKKKK